MAMRDYNAGKDTARMDMAVFSPDSFYRKWILGLRWGTYVVPRCEGPAHIKTKLVTTFGTTSPPD